MSFLIVKSDLEDLELFKTSIKGNYKVSNGLLNNEDIDLFFSENNLNNLEYFGFVYHNNMTNLSFFPESLNDNYFSNEFIYFVKKLKEVSPNCYY
jgi:hypothetical protein